MARLPVSNPRPHPRPGRGVSAPPADAGLNRRLSTLGFVVIGVTAFWGALASAMSWWWNMPW